MAQGKAERMQFLCHCLYNTAGTFKTIAKIHSFPCSSTTAEDVYVSFLMRLYGNCISSDFPFWLFLLTLFFNL